MGLVDKMLFVGVGGTGCLVGQEVERRLREDLCGPDGSALVRSLPHEGLAPFELPASVQFSYLDIDTDTIEQLNGSVPKGTWSRTARSVPFQRTLNTSSQVCAELRGWGLDVTSWLPGEHNEPRVAPLSKGAGQVPMVGRATLFHAVHNAPGVEAFVSPVQRAVDALASSTGIHQALGGSVSPDREIVVYPVFSIAGGTGCGMFLDVIHLIADALDRAQLQWQMFPLVVMPSAFEQTGADLRKAKLNGAMALVDLFRFVDYQNSGAPSRRMSVRFPLRNDDIVVRAAKVTTAVLFGRTAGIELNDLHRSVASFALSLVSTASDTSSGDKRDQSFASTFINGATERQTNSSWGVGLKAVSSSLTASLTIPRDRIATVLARRLLARGLQQMQAVTSNENNLDQVRAFVTGAGLGPLLEASGAVAVTQPDGSVAGAKEITAELARYRDNLLAAVQATERYANAELATRSNFDWVSGVRTVMSRDGVDVYRMRRVLEGVNDSAEDWTRLGVVGRLQRRADAPPKPHDFEQLNDNAPTLPTLSNGLAGMKKLRFNDATVRNAERELSEWYTWRCRAAWASAWARTTTQWQPVVAACRQRMTDLTTQLGRFVAGESDAFRRDCADLYRPRTGVSFFLPPGGSANDLEAFYARMMMALQRDLAITPGLPEPEKLVLRAILDPEAWINAVNQTLERQEHHAANALLEVVKSRVRQVLEGPQGAEASLLPSLEVLLGALHQESMGDLPRLERQLVGQFRSALQDLLPDGFNPDGQTRHSRILVSYPGALSPEAASNVLAPLLQRAVGAGTPFEFRAAQSDALSVTIFKTDMGLLDVGESRELMRFWVATAAKPNDGDYLPWRRRFSTDSSWLLSSEDDRANIMFRFLSCLWDGLVEVEGDAASPTLVRILRANAPGATPISLPVRALSGLTSWGDLVSSYERVTLNGDVVLAQACEAFVNHVVKDIGERPAPPAPLYWDFLRVTEQARAALASGPPGRDNDQVRQLRAFWTATVPAAYHREFDHELYPTMATHAELVAAFSPTLGRQDP